MEHNNTPPAVGEFVRRLMPKESSEEELRIAQQNVDDLMAVMVRIYHRLEVEGKLDEIKKREQDR